MCGWLSRGGWRALRARRAGALASGRGRGSLRKHLERDLASEPRVAGAVDLAHPPRADQRDDFVRAKTSAHREWHTYAEL